MDRPSVSRLPDGSAVLAFAGVGELLVDADLRLSVRRGAFPERVRQGRLYTLDSWRPGESTLEMVAQEVVDVLKAAAPPPTAEGAPGAAFGAAAGGLFGRLKGWVAGLPEEEFGDVRFASYLVGEGDRLIALDREKLYVLKRHAARAGFVLPAEDEWTFAVSRITSLRLKAKKGVLSVVLDGGERHLNLGGLVDVRGAARAIEECRCSPLEALRRAAAGVCWETPMSEVQQVTERYMEAVSGQPELLAELQAYLARTEVSFRAEVQGVVEALWQALGELDLSAPAPAGGGDAADGDEDDDMGAEQERLGLVVLELRTELAALAATQGPVSGGAADGDGDGYSSGSGDEMTFTV